MLARVAHVSKSVMALCLVAAGTPPAKAQALCPEVEAKAWAKVDDRSFAVRLPSAPYVLTVEADLAAFGGTLPGGTWRMPLPGGIAPDGLALEGVSFSRNAGSKLGTSVHTFDVMVDLRAADRILVGLEFVVVDGERSLSLGRFTDIPVRCEAKSASQTFSISDRDFVSYFSGGRAPTLRIKKTTVLNGC